MKINLNKISANLCCLHPCHLCSIFCLIFSCQIAAQPPAKVLIFFHPECPISHKYVHKIDELAIRFPDFQFKLIIPSKDLKKQQIIDFQKEYSIKIPFLIDKKQRLVKQLGAKITPEAFVIDSKNEILYNGLIDNWFYDLGKHRTEATEYYLRDALINISKNKPIKVKKTEAIGCFIEKHF